MKKIEKKINFEFHPWLDGIDFCIILEEEGGEKKKDSIEEKMEDALRKLKEKIDK